jgi:hypothetical protein
MRAVGIDTPGLVWISHDLMMYDNGCIRDALA